MPRLCHCGAYLTLYGYRRVAKNSAVSKSQHANGTKPVHASFRADILAGMKLPSLKNKRLDAGLAFERHLARVFRNLGYGVHLVGGTNDHGADLIVTRRRKKIAVQAKCYAKPVGNAAVQEVYAAKAYYKCDGAWVVTNSTFTQAAVEQAEPCTVRLVDGKKLAAMETRAKTRSWLPGALTLIAVGAISALIVLASRG